MEICVFFFKDTATTEIYTLSLHDALPIFSAVPQRTVCAPLDPLGCCRVARFFGSRDSLSRVVLWFARLDRKSTRLNSSHANISYAVFCLKKNNTIGAQATPG